jgi:hypothetical protein
MRLLRLDDVQTDAKHRVFRYSRPRALLLSAAVLCTSAGLIVFDGRGRFAIGYYIAGVLLVGLMLMRRFVLARFRRSNWLVQTSDDGLFIQFRSYLNYHFSAEDLTVVFVPYQEVQSARLVRERSQIPDDNRVLEQRRRLVEFDLAGDPAALAKVLANEIARRRPNERRWYGSTSTEYKHWPVRMTSPTTLQLEWKVVPGVGVLFEALRPYTTIADSMNVSQDFVHLQGLNREDQEERLRELLQRGQTITAIYIARRLYRYDLTQARAFVEALRPDKTGRNA